VKNSLITPEHSAALLLNGVFSLLVFGVFVATVVVFMIWLYRACNNLPAFGANRRYIGYSPGWAVGSFFVPFANLVVPYRAIKELWQKSVPADAEGFSYAISPPGFFAAWWGFWIISNFAANAYFRMTAAEAPREVTAIVGIVSEVLSVAAAGFAIMVVRDIDRRQQEASKNLPASHGWPSPPPPPDFLSQANLQTPTTGKL